MTSDNLKQKRVAAVIAFILVLAMTQAGCAVAQNPHPAPKKSVGTQKAAGFCAVDTEDFDKAAGLGATVVSLPGPLSSDQMSSAIKEAGSRGLTVLSRAPGESRISAGDRKLDTRNLVEAISSQYEGIDVNETVAGCYLIDEPANPVKWDLGAADLVEAYDAVREAVPGLRIFINMSDLNAFLELDNQAPGGPVFADIISFTVTTAKLRRDPDYVTKQLALAGEIKQKHPELKVYALVGVYGYPQRGEPIPTADWVKSTCSPIAQSSSIDGLMLYSWNRAPYMDKAIADIYGDNDYRDAFKETFK